MSTNKFVDVQQAKGKIIIFLIKDIDTIYADY